MSTTQPELTPELQRALDESGGMIRGSSYVLMTVEQYERLRDMDDELETIRAIEEGLADIDAGRTISLEDFKREFEAKYGPPG